MSNSMTIREAIQEASLLFTQKGILHPRLQAEVLLQHLLGWSKVKLLTEDQQPLPEGVREQWNQMVLRRLEGEPLQYIVGVQEFYGRDFQVNPAVLIPRPETEILIEEVLKRRKWWESGKSLREDRQIRIADIGTGSGAIAITVKLEWPEAEVMTVDISPDAIRVATDNAERLGAEVRFFQGDLVEPLVKEKVKLEILLSNPPYIPTADVEELMVEVRGHEPRLALDGGADGLEPYRRITRELPRVMCEEGPALVGFEVGIHQAQDVAAMIESHWPGAQTEIIPDLQGIERVVLGWKR